MRVHPSCCWSARSCRKTARRDKIWERRYREINDWERYLIDNGFRIVKLFLNLSKEEQRKRFLRADRRPGEELEVLGRRRRASAAYWDDYQLAFSEMLSHTSTEWAPWYVIPADRKWLERLAAAAVLVHTLMAIDPRYPVVDEEQRRELRRAGRSSRPRRPRPRTAAGRSPCRARGAA